MSLSNCTAVQRLGADFDFLFPYFGLNTAPNPPPKDEILWFLEIQMESVQYLCALAVFENHVSYRRLLYEVQNLRAHQRWAKDCNGQRTNAHGRILLPGGVHGKDLQDHRLTAPPNETELV